MKKILLFALTLFLEIGNAIADDQFIVDNIIIPQGGSVNIPIELNNTDHICSGFQFLMMFDKTITVSNPVAGNRVSNAFSLQITPKDDGFQALVHNNLSGQTITGSSGVVMIVTLTADPSLDVGTTIQGSLKDCRISTQSGTSVELDDVNFTITVSDHTILDEKSVAMPLASGGKVDIIVKRTINANEWSTLCLPFDMNEAQLKTAFGDDVELAVFHSYEKENTGDDVTELTVYFDDANIAEYGLYANYPYIIRTSKDITTFEVTAEIDPDEKGAIAKYEVKQGPKTEVHGTLQGTLHAGDAIPADCLFLNGNKFWHSTGATTIKAFRAYFWFKDVISSGGEAKLRLIVNDEVVAIEGVGASSIVKGAVYNVNGQLIGTDIDINSLPKGVYMVDGKKVMNY